MPRTIADAQRALLSALSIAALALTAAPAAAASHYCSAPEYRQLDFWLGNWKAYDNGGAGPYIARDEITATLNGCVVLEQYRQNDGHHGDGVTIYDASRSLWHQTWVTNYGELLILEGRFEGGVLTMSGSALDKDDKRVWYRVSWKQQSTGAHGVREIAVTSHDGGRSWKPSFDILFVKEQPPTHAGDVSSLLHRLTQTFSDAGQQGKGSVVAQYLDDDVIFFNEGGSKATKADMSQNGPPAPGVDRTITTTQWDCKVRGNIAVTSFVDVVEVGPAGQRQEYKYRSVETWLEERGGWKMIGSETLTLHEDPPAVALDQKTLDQYVGSYEASPGTDMTFTRQGDRLLASLNGGAAVAQQAQVRDIVFSPGRSATPKVFQRDDAGGITGFIYLSGNHSLTFKRKSA